MAQSIRKEGIRCECERLLLEKNPELGLGVLCDRCGKFHPLSEINQRAAEFEKEKRREEMGSENEKEKMERSEETIFYRWEGLGRRMPLFEKKELLPIGIGEEIEIKYYRKTSDNYPYEINKYRVRSIKNTLSIYPDRGITYFKREIVMDLLEEQTRYV